MDSEKKGIIIGLTGGIGSGKSTVSRYLMELGWPVVDSDLIAHQVTEKGSPTVDELAEALGGEILREDGSLDRAKTAEICFNDPAKKEILNRIVWGAMDEISDRQTEEGQLPFAVMRSGSGGPRGRGDPHRAGHGKRRSGPGSGPGQDPQPDVRRGTLRKGGRGPG